jgi:hypothetical protein
MLSKLYKLVSYVFISVASVPKDYRGAVASLHMQRTAK